MGRRTLDQIKKQTNIRRMAFPHDGKKFKKGESGNLDGRPVGTKNRSTTAKRWLSVTQDIKNPITQQSENLSQEDIMTLALIKKAREGDVGAYRELMDSGYGKSPSSVDVTTKGESIKPPPITWKPRLDGTSK